MSGSHLNHEHHTVHGGTAVLDIGGDIGAMVALLDRDAEGTELFLRPVEEPTTTVHTGVWTRHQHGDHVTAALFCELRAGSYWVLAPDGSLQTHVEIRGGALTELDLRTRRST